ncbi:hypothetical protein FNF27_03670 [Cafeteria roenbergensis]|uniref:Transmembrane 9 superfamily member n=1 Tax=Cafeteria roenbergensis TaxID=33653 RepID=A0A5A8EA53_CAFRO|nr:hypothetical protein FNF27_03670 [Cafeteria roenbergensis]
MARGLVSALSAAALAACLAAPAGAFYVPGTTPVDFKNDDPVTLHVNKLTSTKTQIPIPYYSLPLCAPESVEEVGVSLGGILTGDRIESSAYELEFRRQAKCQVLCRKVNSEEEGNSLAERIEQEYTVNWIIDNLPAAVVFADQNNEDNVRYQRGFPLGAMTADAEPVAIIFNHIGFHIKYHRETEENRARIVGFVVEPFSVHHEYEGEWSEKTQLKTCNPSQPVTRQMLAQAVAGGGEVIFTYDVEWEESDVQWAHRWDLYLRGSEDAEVHWFAILNSVVIVLFLTGMIAMILVRALHRDIARINDEADDDETGWKLIHGDVFRPPSGMFGPMMLSVMVGSGVQLLCMTIALMIFAVLGVLSPANRGGLATAFVSLFVVMGSFAGFVSSRLYKMFLGKFWGRNAALTAVAFPGSVVTIAFVLNMVLWSRGSTLALPFGTMVAIAALWFFVSAPLVLLGAYIGFTRDAITPVTRVNTFARTIPTQPWYLSPVVTALVGGILPFGAIFIELYFIMTSIWLSQPYYLFGFLALVIVILGITCAEISIVMCYFQLCAEDHRWWWRSFFTSGSSALYIFGYSIVYFATSLDITDPASATLFFGNMLMVSITFFLLTGSIGFLATLAFVRGIFGQIKVD